MNKRFKVFQVVEKEFTAPDEATLRRMLGSSCNIQRIEEINFTSADIVVGQTYLHRTHVGAEYLGCAPSIGQGKKFLVVVKSPHKSLVGATVVDEKSDPHNVSFWNDFYEKGDS